MRELFMPSKRYESAEIDRSILLHVSSRTHWSTSSDSHKVVEEKKKKIWLSPLTKTHTTTEKYKTQRDNTKTPPKLRLYNDCGPT